jgi:hypothetical protein
VNRPGGRLFDPSAIHCQNRYAGSGHHHIRLIDKGRSTGEFNEASSTRTQFELAGLNRRVYSVTFEQEKKAESLICGGQTAEVIIFTDWMVDQLAEHLAERQSI